MYPRPPPAPPPDQLVSLTPPPPPIQTAHTDITLEGQVQLYVPAVVYVCEPSGIGPVDVSLIVIVELSAT